MHPALGYLSGRYRAREVKANKLTDKGLNVTSNITTEALVQAGLSKTRQACFRHPGKVLLGPEEGHQLSAPRPK